MAPMLLGRAMRVFSLLAILLLPASPTSAADSPFLHAAARLDGEWRGDDYALWVDSYRAQANVDATRPFHWQRFLVRNVADERITFTVGSELFEATLQDDSLTLTSTSFRGERTLERHPARAAAR